MLLQLVSVQSATAASDRGISFLEQRFESWPQWSLPAPLPRPRSKQDLIYPDWFSGTWEVTSEALDDSGQPIPKDLPLVHKVRFQRNRRSELIGVRPFNAAAVGKALLGEQSDVLPGLLGLLREQSDVLHGLLLGLPLGPLRATRAMATTSTIERFAFRGEACFPQRLARGTSLAMDLTTETGRSREISPMGLIRQRAWTYPRSR